jgi:hypothetical protein
MVDKSWGVANRESLREPEGDLDRNGRVMGA